MNATSRSANEFDRTLASVKWPAAPYGKLWVNNKRKWPRPPWRERLAAWTRSARGTGTFGIFLTIKTDGG
jgi:hypothetical protein